MRFARLLACLVVLVAPLSAPLGAVQPDEVLADTALETRARDISRELRCLVCRNENIDDSDAGLARDLRLLVRERLSAGDTDDETVAFIVARYGEFVLLKPRLGGANLILWAAGPVLLLVALFFGYRAGRLRAEPVVGDLSDAEAARLAELLED